MAGTPLPLVLTGEDALIVEFGTVCHTAGFPVFCHACGQNGVSDVPFPPFIQTAGSLPKDALCLIELSNIDKDGKRRNVEFLDREFPSSLPILTSAIAVPVSEQSSWVSHPERVVGLGALPTFFSGSLVELSAGVRAESRAVADIQALFHTLGKETVIVQDRVGMVFPRILCMLINEAFFALMEGIASPKDIDTAMKLATNYPWGPLEWADRIGLPSVVTVLEALQNDLREDRYRIAPLLLQMSRSGKWWASELK